MKRIVLIVILLLPILGIAQDIGSYLILSDIGDYKYRPRRTSEIYGNSGILISAGHFDMDHNDTTYKTRYVHPVTILGVDAQITQYTTIDSDKWLLHEMDIDFRNYYGIPGGGYAVVPIDGNYILEFGSAGWDYRWLSGNKIIKIDYHDSQMTKPEPLEVVKAYLAKHPSTIPALTLSQLRSAANKTAWIKDEMDRRLWLGDKWYAQIQPSDPKLRDKLKSMTDSMVVFLNYREKYFSIASKDEKIALETALYQNNTSAVQAKLTEYKIWWAAHKADSITLP